MSDLAGVHNHRSGRAAQLDVNARAQHREGVLLEKLDAQHKLTTNQWKIAFAATIGDMLDFFDFGLIAFVLAFISSKTGT